MFNLEFISSLWGWHWGWTFIGMTMMMFALFLDAGIGPLVTKTCIKNRQN
jgi:hypothetical protein